MENNSLPNTMQNSSATNQNSSKKNLYRPAFMVGIFVIVVLGMIAYILFTLSHKSVNKPVQLSHMASVTLIPTPAINWATYTNPQYGYTISYPLSWSVQNLGTQGSQELYVTNFNPPSENDHTVTIIVSTKSNQQPSSITNLVDTVRAVTVNSVAGSEHVESDAKGNQTLVATFPLADKVIIVRAASNDVIFFDNMVNSLKFKK